MKSESDPIVAEVRAARAQHAAQFGYDVKAVFEDIRARQQGTGRTYVRYPARRLAATTRPTSNE